MQKRNLRIQREEKPSIPDAKALDHYLNHSDIDNSLAELVRIRTSQLIKCGSCTDTYMQRAKINGEKKQRITGLNIWPESSFYSDKERAALAWTEVMTRFSKKNIEENLYEEVSSYLSNEEMDVLSNTISLMQRWKRGSINETQPAEQKKIETENHI